MITFILSHYVTSSESCEASIHTGCAAIKMGGTEMKDVSLKGLNEWFDRRTLFMTSSYHSHATLQ
jgi:hypothetical protein